MAGKSYGWSPTPTGGVALPWVLDRDGHKRFLAALPTPKDHVVRLAPHISAAVPVLTMTELAAYLVGGVYDRRPADVGILDQDGVGSCVCYAAGSGVMRLRSLAGEPHVDLSPDWLYTEVNGGRDAGSNIGDAAQVLKTVGIPRKELVPAHIVRPKGYSAAATADAARFKVTDYYTIDGRSGDVMAEVLTAILFGFSVCYDVCAGPRYDTDSAGFVTPCRGFNNHEQLAANRFGIDPKRGPWAGMFNSWAKSWGDQGEGKAVSAFFEKSDSILAFQYAQGDPQQPAPPVPA